MFNLTRKIDIFRYHKYIDRQMFEYEKKMGGKWFAVLNNIYKDAAEVVASDDINDLTSIFLVHNVKIKEVVNDTYRNALAYFGTLTFHFFKQSLEDNKKRVSIPYQKGMEEAFWEEAQVWLRTYAAKEVVNVLETTKQMLRTHIRIGMEGGMSNREIAKMILEEKSPVINAMRAARIVRTETHTAANKAIDAAIKSTGYDHIRTWITALDERVRGVDAKDRFNHVVANGQQRGMDDPFDVSGEKLMFPGDMNGSAGNIIHCRCVVIYETKLAIAKKPVPFSVPN